MAPPVFLDRFLTYRFEYAALVFDAAKTFWSGDDYHWHARVAAALLALFLLIPPSFSLIIGADPFGNEYVFAATLVLWPYFLEKPGWAIRQQIAAGTVGTDEQPGRFDAFLLIGLSVVALGAVAFLGIYGQELREGGLEDAILGAVWGVAIAGVLDLTRSALASALAATRGYPMYGSRGRKPSD